MKKVGLLVLALCLVLSMVACASPAEAPAESAAAATSEAAAAESSEEMSDFEPVVLRLGHSHSETENQHTEFLAMAEQIAERTNGNVTVEVYANNSIGTNEDVLEQMRYGTNVAYHTDAGRLDTYVPGMAAISAPYVMESYEEFASLKDLPTVQAWHDTLENEIGLSVIAWNWCQGYRNIFANATGTTPDDFSGVQLRSAPAPIWVSTVETLGATPVSLEFGEMYSGIQTKIVDGCEQNYGSIYNNNIQEVISTMVETKHVYLSNTIVISTEWLRSLPQEYQDIIIEECEAAGERSSKFLEEQDQFYFDEMVAQGMEVVPYEDLDIDAFKANAEKAYEDLNLTEAVNSLKADLGK